MSENSKNEKPSKARRIWHKIAIYLSAIVVILLAGGCYAYMERTMVEPWKPIAVGATMGIILTVIVMKYKPEAVDSFLKKLLAWIAGATVSLFLLLCINFHCGPADTQHTETITVERKYHEKRYRTQRVRKNVTRRGQPYNVYFIDARFNNGWVKKFGVTLSRYNAIKQGETLKIDMRQGLFGLPVITSRNI